MQAVTERVLFFLVMVGVLLLAAGYAGSWLRERRSNVLQNESFKTLESAMLGLLALLLGFSFAMAVNRYDLRRQLEVGEANAIGTAWLRMETLPEPARSSERQMLREYVPVRLAFFDAGEDRAAIAQTLARTGELQGRIWSIAVTEAQTRRDPVSAQLLSSLNDMFDMTEKRTAAFENRIPGAAWALLLFIGMVSSVLVGMNTARHARVLLLALPIVVGGAMMLIADLDSPRSGFVRVHQDSMKRLAAQVNAR